MTAYQSAMITLPVVFSRIGVPLTVLDVGCGDGSWMRAASECGAVTVKGMDRTNNKDDLLVPSESITACDLHEAVQTCQFGSPVFDASNPLVPAPPDSSKRWDLIICVEVAEHLREEAALPLVWALTAAGRAILWSAALPGQGPYDPINPDNPSTHRNEQWPWYWEQLFARWDYYPVDFVRPAILGNQTVDWWYRQGLVLYANPSALAPLSDELMVVSRGILQEALRTTGGFPR